MSDRSRRYLSQPVLVAWVVLAVGVSVALGLVLGLTLFAPNAPPCTSLECGPTFVVGDPNGPTYCSASEGPSPGCLGTGDYVYRLTIETSSMPLGDLRLVVKTATGSTYLAPGRGGFFVVGPTGTIVASYEVTSEGPLVFPSSAAWTYYTATTGISGDTPLTSLDGIVVDVGSVDTGGQGLTLQFMATTQPGSSAPVQLP